MRAAGSIVKSHASRGRRAALIVNSLRPIYQRVHSFDGDWHRALEILAAVEPDGHASVANLLADEAGPAARAVELTVVTSALAPRLVERLAHRALGNHAASVVYVDARASRSRGVETPLRPARPPRSSGSQRAGVPVLVLRRGDDLAARPDRRGAAGRWLGAGSSSSSSASVVTVSWARLEIPVDRLARRAADAPARAPADRGGRPRPVPRSSSRLVLARLDASRRGDRLRRPALDARPRDPSRDFFGPVLDGIRRGFLDFYETQLPFDRIDFPSMQTRRPARRLRLHRGRRHARDGAAAGRRRARARRRRRLAGDARTRARARCSRASLALVGVLAILFLLRRDEPPRGLVQAGAVAVVLVALAGGRLDHRRGGQARLPLLADLGSLRPADRAGLGLLRLERELRRDHVPRGADHGHAGEGPGAEALALLARDDARRLHRPDLGRGRRS